MFFNIQSTSHKCFICEIKQITGLRFAWDWEQRTARCGTRSDAPGRSDRSKNWTFSKQTHVAICLDPAGQEHMENYERDVGNARLLSLTPLANYFLHSFWFKVNSPTCASPHAIYEAFVSKFLSSAWMCILYYLLYDFFQNFALLIVIVRSTFTRCRGWKGTSFC